MAGLFGKGRSRWAVRVAILLLLGAVGLFWFSWQELQKRLTIENRSELAITRLKITCGEESQTFQNVASGSDVSSTFKVANGDHIEVDGELANKSRIKYLGVAPETLHLVVLKGGNVVPRQKDQR